MDTPDWVEAGLYHPDAPAAEERRTVLEYLTERGATIPQMRDADRLGRLPAVAGELAQGPKAPTIPIDEFAARCGVPEGRLRRILLATGLPVGPDDRLSTDLEDVIAGFELGAALMGEEAVLAFTRVLGAAATNIAEAATALFYSELGPGSGREGHDDLARARQAEEAALAFQVVPGVLSRVVLAQFDRAIRQAPQLRDRTVPAGDAAELSGTHPSALVALGFVDLVGSTAWAEELSLRDQSLALSRFESSAWSTAVLAGGRVVKMIGDEVFFAAPSVETACRIGLEVCRAAGEDPVLPAARGAVGYGSVTAREGDFFGPLVNLVSRLVKAAAPGQLVLTEGAAGALPPERWELRDLGPQPVRGLDRLTPLFAIGSGR